MTEIGELRRWAKELPPLQVKACATCAFLKSAYSECGALGGGITFNRMRHGACGPEGKFWSPRKVGVIGRVWRWLAGGPDQ